MPRATARGEAASNKHEAILAAALRLFAARGVDGTSMRDLAAAVGLTEGTLYHYFPTKRELVAATFGRTAFGPDEIDAAFRDASEPAQALREAGCRFLDVLARDPDWTRAVLREALRTEADQPDLRDLVLRLGRHRVARLGARLDAPRARLFFHALMGYWISEGLVGETARTPAARRAFVSHLVLRLLGAPRRPRRRTGGRG